MGVCEAKPPGGETVRVSQASALALRRPRNSIVGLNVIAEGVNSFLSVEARESVLCGELSECKSHAAKWLVPRKHKERM